MAVILALIIVVFSWLAEHRFRRSRKLPREEKTDGRWRGGRPRGAKDRQPRRRRDQYHLIQKTEPGL
jgi:hypothetical protein